MSLALTRDLVTRFGDFSAVDHVDMSVEAGEVVGLLGANGAGKTTLIRTLLGLQRASAGVARLFDRAPSRATRRRVGYVPQTLGLYADLTVNENWLFAEAAFHSGAPAPPEVAPWADTLVSDLPLGSQRQVAFAQALAHRPELLILDEPTSGVGPLGRARLWERIRAAADAGAGTLVTTHDMEEAEQCDRLMIMVRGVVVARGTETEIVAGHQVVQVRCDDWRGAASALDAAGLAVQLHGRTLRVPSELDTVRSALQRADIVAQLDLVDANLEEAFVSLVAAASHPS